MKFEFVVTLDDGIEGRIDLDLCDESPETLAVVRLKDAICVLRREMMKRDGRNWFNAGTVTGRMSDETVKRGNREYWKAYSPEERDAKLREMINLIENPPDWAKPNTRAIHGWALLRETLEELQETA